MASDADGATLLDLRAAVAEWYRTRVASFFRRTLNQGLGAFLLFAVSITVAGLAWRLVWIGGSEDKKSVETLMSAKIEPQSSEAQGAVLSLLLAALDDRELAASLYCNGRQTGGCGTGLMLWRRTQQLIDASNSAAGDVGSKVDGVSATERSSSGGIGGATELTGRLVAEFSANVARRRRLRGVPVEQEYLPASMTKECAATAEERTELADRSAVFQMALPICRGDGASETFEIVPVETADATESPAYLLPGSPPAAASGGAEEVSGQTAEPPAGAVLRVRDLRVQRARLDGELFDIAASEVLARNMHPPGGGPVEGGPEIAAAYFISVDSVFRYWARRKPAWPSDFPPYRLWAARRYFEELLETADYTVPTETRGYMDFGGNGIVATECRALVDDFPSPDSMSRELAESLSRQETGGNNAKLLPGTIVGAVCVDYALTGTATRELVKVINAGPIARAALVPYASGSPGQWISEASTADVPYWARSRGVRAALESAVERLDAKAANRREIAPLPEEGTGSLMYLVPSRFSADGTSDGILVNVVGIGPLGSRPWAMGAGLILSALAVGALVSGFSNSRELAKRERLLGRLRSLQVAVIQTGKDDTITEANDRAEELIGKQLPAFGLEPRARPRFWDVFDRRSVLLLTDTDPGAPAPSRVSELSVRMGTPDEIKRAREAGQTSTYYVRLLAARSAKDRECRVSTRWIRVIGGPILRPALADVASTESSVPSSGGDDSQTFGILEPVLREFEPELERKLS